MTSLSNLTLVRCTEEQKLECRRHAWAQWGYSGTFTHDEWVGRDEQFDKTPWAKSDGGNGFVTWALVPRSDPTTLDMLSHCETYRRPSIMAAKGSEVKEVVSYGIATVITPPIHRGNAYGRFMLQLLHYVIAPLDKLPPFPKAWGSPPQFSLNDGEFSVLYSGVGTKFYASCTRGDGETKMDGWVWVPTTKHKYKLDSKLPEVDESGWKWLSVQDVADLEPRIAEDMKKALKGSKHNSYAILPTNSTLSTHALRNTLSPSGKIGRTHGLVLPLPGNPFVIYTYPVGGKMDLQITYIHPGVPFSAVLAAAKREKCPSISIWGPSSRGGEEATRAAIETRQKWDSEAEFHSLQVEKDHHSETACWVVYGEQEDNDWCFRESYVNAGPC